MALTEKLTAIADAIRTQSGKTGKLTLAQMPDEIINLQSLSFEVVGGSKPTDPKENTIWVDTTTAITSWQFASNDPNLLDFNTWANSIGVSSGTKTVTANAITLTASGSDCYTHFSNNYEYVKIPCTPGKTYVMEWYVTGSQGWVYIFPNATSTGSVRVDNKTGRAEYTATSGISYFTFRIGVSVANTSATYSNIRITEKERAFEPGSVWISTGTSSPVAFNALKENTINVYPISAKQYVGGEWVSKTALTYQGGEWKSWVTYYYKDGNTYDDVTGGYTLDDATLEADNIKIHITSDGQVGYITTNNKVDVSGISTLSVKFNIKTVSSYGRTSTVYLYASDSELTSPDQSVGSGATVTKAYEEGIDMEDTISLDVSSVTGEKYIFVGVKNGGKYLTTTMNVKEIRGE